MKINKKIIKEFVLAELNEISITAQDSLYNSMLRYMNEGGTLEGLREEILGFIEEYEKEDHF